jgi:hypothetical protein
VCASPGEEAAGWLAAYSSELLWRIWPDVNVVPARLPSAKNQQQRSAVLNARRGPLDQTLQDLARVRRFQTQHRP